MNDTIIQDVISRYCDLTPDRLDILQRIRKGEKISINGAMKEAMQDALTRNYNHAPMISAHGEWLIERAEKLSEGWLPEPEENAIEISAKMDTNLAAKRLRQKKGYEWVRSVHLKVLRSLMICPEETWKFLGRIYGYAVISMLRSKGLIHGADLTTFGAPVRITGDGKNLLEYAVELSKR